MSTVTIEFTNTGDDAVSVLISDSKQSPPDSFTIRPNQNIRRIVTTSRMLYLSYKRGSIEQRSPRSFQKYVMIDVNRYFVDTPETRRLGTASNYKAQHTAPVERCTVANMMHGISRFFQSPAASSMNTKMQKSQHIISRPCDEEWEVLDNNKKVPVNPPGIYLGNRVSRNTITIKDTSPKKKLNLAVDSEYLTGDRTITGSRTPRSEQQSAETVKSLPRPAENTRLSRTKREVAKPRVRTDQSSTSKYAPNVKDKSSCPRSSSKSAETYERLPGSGVVPGRIATRRPSYAHPIVPQARDSGRNGEILIPSEIRVAQDIEPCEEKSKVSASLDSPHLPNIIEDSLLLSDSSYDPLRVPNIQKMSLTSNGLNEAADAPSTAASSSPSSEKWKRTGKADTDSQASLEVIMGLQEEKTPLSLSASSSGGKWLRASRRNGPRILDGKMPSTSDILMEAMRSFDETESSSSSSSSSSGEKWQRAGRSDTPGSATPTQNVEVGEKDISIDQTRRIVLEALIQHATK